MKKKTKAQISLQKGFTLIELIVVIMVLVLISGISGALLSSVLRSSSKTVILTQARQNGNNALFQMQKAIEYAKVFKGMGPSYDTTCSVPPAPLIQYSSIKIMSFASVDIEYSCVAGPPATINATINANSASLLDTSNIMIEVGTCYFTCQRTSTTDNPVIGIHYSIIQQNANPVAEKAARVDFYTTALMRNLQ